VEVLVQPFSELARGVVKGLTEGGSAARMRPRLHANNVVQARLNSVGNADVTNLGICTAEQATPHVAIVRAPEWAMHLDSRNAPATHRHRDLHCHLGATGRHA